MGETLMRMEQAAAGAVAPPPAPSEGWRTCDVLRVGPGWGKVYLRLVCIGVAENWFIARADQKEDMLAAGLTAISLKNKVQVCRDHKPTGYHEIRAWYVLQLRYVQFR